MVTILAVFVEPPSSYSEHCVPRRAENFHYYYLTVQDFCPPLPLAADYLLKYNIRKSFCWAKKYIVLKEKDPEWA